MFAIRKTDTQRAETSRLRTSYFLNNNGGRMGRRETHRASLRTWKTRAGAERFLQRLRDEGWFAREGLMVEVVEVS